MSSAIAINNGIALLYFRLCFSTGRRVGVTVLLGIIAVASWGIALLMLYEKWSAKFSKTVCFVLSAK